MAGNVNTAARAFWRNATRFNRLAVKLKRVLSDSPDEGAYLASPMAVISVPPGQTGNALEFQDASGNVLAAIDAAGNLPETSIRYASVTVSSTDIKALFTTAKPLVAAPGAGKVIEFVRGTISSIYGTAAYVINGSTNLSVKYKDKGGADVSSTIATTGLVDQIVNVYSMFQPLTAQLALDTNAVNQPLCLACLVANPTTGDGALKVNIAYRVHTLV
jgi:hypothetical protein